MTKMGDHLDLAYAAVYVTSDKSKYLTSIELNVHEATVAGAAASPK